MGGLVGAVTTKFAIASGMLLLSARVGMHHMEAVLDPAVHTTLMTPKAAGIGDAATDGARIDGDRWIGLDAHMLRIRKVEIQASLPADTVLGADVLESGSILLDFKAHRVRVLETGELRRNVARMAALPAAMTPDGCLSVIGSDENGRSVGAAFIARPVGQREGVATSLRAGDTQLLASRPAKPACSSDQLELGWAAFAGRRVIFDLGHGKIWVSSDGGKS